MLVEFTVGNFRSIAERVTLSMIAAPIKSGSHAKNLDEENVIRIDDKLSLLKTAAIYGANASGKSNILGALITMGTFMEVSVRAERSKLPYMPFLLMSGYQNMPSHFEIIFLIKGIQYRYGFEISASRVEREWLYFVPTIKEAKIFERVSDDFGTIGKNFKGANALKPRVAPKALFLTVCRDFNIPLAREIFEWAHCFSAMHGSRDTESAFTIHCLEEKKRCLEIVDFITRLDLGISDIEVSELPGKIVEDDTEDGKIITSSYKVETLHRTYDPQGNSTGNVKLDMGHHESAGTQKLFAMSARIVEVLKNGHILAIDEMDARLHPSLTRKIVELFHSRETNPKNAQLIFATHDTNLLDNRLFRRDQIWFAEKNRVGATDLYSLAELKVRNDASYEKDYIEGLYGAIPFPGGFERIFNPPEAGNARQE